MTDNETTVVSVEQVVRLEEATAALSSAVQGLKESVKGLSTYTHRTRHYIRWLVISIALDVLLTFGLGYVGFQGHEAANQALQDAHSTKAFCVSSNVARAENLELWDHLFAVSSPPKTKEGAAKLKELRVYIDHTFAPRDCSNIVQK